MRKSLIKEFYFNLDEFNKKLVEHYIDTDYVPKVRTGQGKKIISFMSIILKKELKLFEKLLNLKNYN
jgi:hypothetical protein